MSDQTVLLLHGWGGNKPEHWQEWLYKQLQQAGVDVRYPKFPKPEAPMSTSWLIHLEKVRQELPAAEKVTVLCHSLACINWMNYVPSVGRQIADRVLLVAPPYVSPLVPPADTPPGISSFFPPQLDPESIKMAARETTIIAGKDDCYGTEDQIKAYSDRLGIPMYLLEVAGHVSPFWGYGPWVWVREWTLHRTDLPPQTRHWGTGTICG